MKTVITAIAAAFGLIAAVLWYKASAVEAFNEPGHPDGASTVVFFAGEHQWDPIRTALLQTKWNKRAALAASLAAALQSISLFLPEGC